MSGESFIFDTGGSREQPLTLTADGQLLEHPAKLVADVEEQPDKTPSPATGPRAKVLTAPQKAGPRRGPTPGTK